jgi:hypothetical protein
VVFKGGTCLKKCYLETFRFSEDLDFTVIEGGPIAEDEVLAHLSRMLERIGRDLVLTSRCGDQGCASGRTGASKVGSTTGVPATLLAQPVFALTSQEMSRSPDRR